MTGDDGRARCEQEVPGGRDIYIAEGCYNCHSQMIRPFLWEVARYGEAVHRDDVEVTLEREHNPSIRNDHVAEAVVFTKGPNLVARESATTYEAAVDMLVEKLERQIERYRDKRVHEPRRQAQRKKGEAAGEEAA